MRHPGNLEFVRGRGLRPDQALKDGAFALGPAGAAAGLFILPGCYRRALAFIDRTGTPLLESVGRPTIELSAFRRNWGTLPWTLCVGNAEDGPPEMTLREFAERYGVFMSAFLSGGVPDRPEHRVRSADWLGIGLAFRVRESA